MTILSALGATGWQVGDSALCVDASPCEGFQPEADALAKLEVGRFYTVDYIQKNGGIYLREIPTLCAFYASRFRKVRHGGIEEDCDPEFIELMQRAEIAKIGGDA